MLCEESKTTTREGVSNDVGLGGDSDGHEVNVLPETEGKDLAKQRLGGRIADRALSQAILDVLVIHVKDHFAVSSPARREASKSL